MSNLHMQSKLGGHHDSVKQFPNGNPIHEAFYKKVKTPRIKSHVDFMVNEELTKRGISVKAEELESVLKHNYKRFTKLLRARGYQIN